MTYNLTTDLNVPLKIHTHYFGQPSGKLDRQKNDTILKAPIVKKDEENSDDDDSDEDIEGYYKQDELSWKIKSLQQMEDASN